MAPEYPPAARENGLECRVLVDVSIDAQGRVTAVNVVKSNIIGDAFGTASEARQFEAASVKAVLLWTFAPAHESGEPVACQQAVPLEFSLEG